MRRLVVAAAFYVVALFMARTAAVAQVLQLERDDVVLHYWPNQERLARALLPSPSLLVFAGLSADVFRRHTPVHVYLAPDPARWDSLTGGRAPDWGAGIAVPTEDKIVIPGYVSDRATTQDLPRILRHELAHIALHRFLGGALIPRWFNEGYAMWSAGEFDAETGWKLRLAFVTRRAAPLDSLTLDWPLLAADAELAYLLSGTAVRYLYSLGNAGMFERFLHSWRDGGSFESALRGVYVLSSAQFERQWRRHVKRQFGWIQVIAQAGFVWTVLTLIIVVFFFIRRRRDRRKLAQLRATEPPDEPAYWIEPPPSEQDDDERPSA
jgi:hypothetical protein